MAKKEKAPKAAKAKPKKKPQFNAEQGGIGKLFQQHGEKIAFAIVFIASAALIYLGWTASTTLAPDLTQQSPEKILTLAKNADVHIKRTDPSVIKTPEPLAGIVETVSLDPWDSFSDKFPSPKPTPRSIKSRKDPKLFPPIKPEITAVTGAVAKKKLNEDMLDHLSQLKDWSEKVSNTAAGGGEAGGPGAPGGVGGGASPGRPGGPGGRPGGVGGPGGAGLGGPGPGGMMGGGGGDNLVGLLNDGFQSVGGSKYEPVTTYAIVSKWLLPNELQVLEYKDKFDGTDESSQPNLLGFQIQRTEVKGPTDTAFNWATIASNLDCDAAELIEKYGWENVGQLVADPSVYHANLTMPTPPFLSRDYYDFSLHTETPKGMSILMEPEKPKEEEQKDKKERKPGEFRIDPNAGIGGGLAGMPGGMPGGPSGMRGGNPYGGGRGGAPGMLRGGRPGGGDEEGVGGGMGMSSPGGLGMGALGGGMYGGGGGSYGSGLSKYYLLRYCDVDVEPGKYYRYRVRVIYEDPNKPMNESFGTRPAAMDESVLERQHKEQLEREKEGVKDPMLQHMRYTDWSEPTPVGKVVDGNYAFTGSSSNAYGGSTQRIPGIRARFFGNEPSVQVVPVVYDDFLGCDIYANSPIEMVYRGAVLDLDVNGTTKKKAIHPITREAKEVTEYPSNTGITVVDILGGETTAFKSGDVEALLAPVDVMMVDQSGRVVIRSDMVDETDYYKFVERKEPRRRQEAGGGLGGNNPYGGGRGGAPGDANGGRGSTPGKNR